MKKTEEREFYREDIEDMIRNMEDEKRKEAESISDYTTKKTMRIKALERDIRILKEVAENTPRVQPEIFEEK
jgi:hypothetical protein